MSFLDVNVAIGRFARPAGGAFDTADALQAEMKRLGIGEALVYHALAAEGAAILLSSHALTEVEARTDRIVILSQGRLMANDTLAALRRRAALPIRLQISARPGAADEVAATLAGGRRNGVMVDLTCAHDEKLNRLGDIAALRDLIEDVEIIPPSLEDIYSHFSRRDGQ